MRRSFLQVQEEFGSFDAFIWQFVDGKPKQNCWRSLAEIPASTPESDAMSKELKRRGFKFVGSTICYAHMQATGMVNDHTADCFRYKELIAMTLKFTKMHGAGNDFVVLDGVRQPIALTPEQLSRYMADRHFGVGCDQILLVEKTQREDADFRYRIFNADGGEVEQCGNGARCFVRFVHDQKLTSKREIVVETKERADFTASGRRWSGYG